MGRCPDGFVNSSGVRHLVRREEITLFAQTGRSEILVIGADLRLDIPDREF